MKKLKLDFQHLRNAEVLTRSQLKQIMGGDGGSGGKCYLVQGEGRSSCWYSTSGNADSLCNRVYPNDTCISTLANGNGECGEGCHMN